jgi:hypothetical protein
MAILFGLLPLLTLYGAVGHISTDSVWLGLLSGLLWCVLGIASSRVAALDAITVLGKDKRLLVYARLTAQKFLHPDFFLQTPVRIECVAQVDIVVQQRLTSCRVRLRSSRESQWLRWQSETSWSTPILFSAEAGQVVCRYCQQMIGLLSSHTVIEPVIAQCNALER